MSQVTVPLVVTLLLLAGLVVVCFAFVISVVVGLLWVVCVFWILLPLFHWMPKMHFFNDGPINKLIFCWREAEVTMKIFFQSWKNIKFPFPLCFSKQHVTLKGFPLTSLSWLSFQSLRDWLQIASEELRSSHMPFVSVVRPYPYLWVHHAACYKFLSLSMVLLNKNSY